MASEFQLSKYLRKLSELPDHSGTFQNLSDLSKPKKQFKFFETFQIRAGTFQISSEPAMRLYFEAKIAMAPSRLRNPPILLKPTATPSKNYRCFRNPPQPDSNLPNTFETLPQKLSNYRTLAARSTFFASKSFFEALHHSKIRMKRFMGHVDPMHCSGVSYVSKTKKNISSSVMYLLRSGAVKFHSTIWEDC